MPNVATTLANVLNPFARFRKKQTPELTQKPVAPAPMTTLNRILMIVLQRPVSQDSFRVMTRQMSPDTALVSTTKQLQRGELLEAQILVHHGYLVKMEAEVEWIVRNDEGFMGRLKLRPQPNARAKLESYLLQISRL